MPCLRGSGVSEVVRIKHMVERMCIGVKGEELGAGSAKDQVRGARRAGYQVSGAVSR